MKTVIIGGVAGGATAAARLRRLDENMEIVMIERGEYISFANCGLPYYIGGEITEKSALTLQTPNSFSRRYNVNILTCTEVIAINKQDKTVTVKTIQDNTESNISYDKLIMSTGAEPIVPKGITLSDKVFTLRNIDDTYKIKDFIDKNAPKTAVVAGGGYIGIEMAENLCRARLDVTLIEAANQIITPLDEEMAMQVQKHINGKGVKLMLNTRLINAAENTSDSLEISTSNGCFNADMVIIAVGVYPESKLAKDCGLDVNGRDCVCVNENMRTSDENIYAVGDVIEVTEFVTGEKVHIPLAGPANKQGRIAADNICGKPSVYKGTQGSSILRAFDMTAAATGVNEKTAKKLNLNYDKVYIYPISHAGYYRGASPLSVKVVFEKDSGKILGAQIVGHEGVDKRTDVFAAAIRAGMTAYDLTELELCYAPPFSSAKDPVNMAGYVIQNIVDGLCKQFHWHDVDELVKNGNGMFIDVRSPSEYANGHIDGFVNIPLEQMRKEISDPAGDFAKNKGKKFYVTCQVGFRGYLAARILSQNGFDAYNLSGGYRMYSLF